MNTPKTQTSNLKVFVNENKFYGHPITLSEVVSAIDSSIFDAIKKTALKNDSNLNY